MPPGTGILAGHRPAGKTIAGDIARMKAALREKYAEGFQIFRELYPALRQVHWRIFRQAAEGAPVQGAGDV